MLKAALNLIPFGGGSLASLAEFIPTARQRNTEKAIDFFRQRLIDLESRIDAEAVNKEEFSELFQTCSRTMERTHRDKKLSAAANILANLLLKPGDQAKVPYEERIRRIASSHNANRQDAHRTLHRRQDVNPQSPAAAQKIIARFLGRARAGDTNCAS